MVKKTYNQKHWRFQTIDPKCSRFFFRRSFLVVCWCYGVRSMRVFSIASAEHFCTTMKNCLYLACVTKDFVYSKDSGVVMTPKESCITAGETVIDCLGKPSTVLKQGLGSDVRPDERPAVRRERPEHVWGPPSAFLRRYLANTGPRPT